MPRPAKELAGKLFGLWTVIERAGSNKTGALWKCRCTCGHEQILRSATIVSGKTTRCKACQVKARDARKMRRLDAVRGRDEEVVRAWQTATSRGAVADLLGLSAEQIGIIVARLRHRGVRLKRMYVASDTLEYYRKLATLAESLSPPDPQAK
jgi:xanthine dehydrogenase iron-sulfur cluster and FAD-binding subunit A